MSPARMAELERELHQAAAAAQDAWVRERLAAAGNEIARALFGPPQGVYRIEPL